VRILILHDYLDNIGGGEKLMLTLARGIGADVATLDYNPRLAEAMGFGDVAVRSLGATPKLPPLKQVAASLRHRFADFRREYDYFILSGNWSHYAGARHRPNLWYCYTPVRAFYSDYSRLRAGFPFPKNVAFAAWAAAHSVFDRASVRGLDRVVSISQTVKERVRRYYGRESEIVYPGVDTGRFRYGGNGDYWLSVNRLYPEKRVHLQAEAFGKMPEEKLVVVGESLAGDHSAPYAKKLREEAPSNVKFLGTLREDELAGLYSRCRGFICTAVDEDFGMTPVEAMAAGKPVVATREGGYLETVVDGETGVFVEPSAEDIVRGVKLVGEDPGRFRRACEARAARFDNKAFIEGMRALIGI
jgi:glycosyltransferase involved in cell wall biosynthesis